MKPNAVFDKCNNDHLFLLKDYTKDLLIISTMILALLALGRDFSSEFSFGLLEGIVSVLSIPFGWMIAAFLHKSGHGNVGKGLVNRAVGEFTGFFVGYGYYNFILVHTLHHKYSDHKYDPVSPKGMSFTRFLLSPIKYMIEHTKEYLRDTHGHQSNYELILGAQTVVFYFNLIARQVFLFLLLGPSFYVCFYLVAVSSNIAILAHINYTCHRDLPDGSVEVFNLDHNLYYRFANFITMGGYYHKNHHLNLSLFDPRKYSRGDRRLLTVKPNSQEPSHPQKTPHRLLRVVAKYFDLEGVWGKAA